MRLFSCRELHRIVASLLLGTGLTQVGSAQSIKPVIPKSVAPETPVSRHVVAESVGVSTDSQLIARSFSDVTLENALTTIARDAGYALVYNKRDVDLSKRVTIKLQQVTLGAALNELLKGTGYRGTIVGKSRTVVITSFDNGERQGTSHILSGRVTDSTTKKTLTGVTVSIVGLKRNTTTGEDGRYRFTNVPDGTHTVTVRFLGYNTKSQSVKFSEDTIELNFRLVQSTTTLSEVVTTVTGPQRKLEIGNAITSINVDSIMQVAPITSLTDLLENRVPGLSVQRSTGQPGDPSRLRLRGSSSIYGSNDMIVVVDGVRIDGSSSSNGAPSSYNGREYLAASPFDQIDPNSIERVDVFKGPSAAAMYGSDAANGVIVITTKRGRPGPARWSITANQGVSYIPGKFPMGLFRFGTLMGVIPMQCPMSDLGALAGIECEVDSVVAFQALNDPHYTVLGTGTAMGQSITASGGSQTLQYAMTGSTSRDIGVVKMSEYLIDRYHRNHGVALPTWMKRPDQFVTWGGNGKLSAQVNPTFRVELTSQIFNSNQRKSGLGSTAISVWMSKFYSDTLSPNEDRFYERVTRHQVRYTNTANVSWDIASWLPLTASVGLDAITADDEIYSPQGVRAIPDTLGFYGTANTMTQSRSLTVNSRIPLFAERIITSVGANIISQDNEGLQAQVRGLPAGVTIPQTGFTDVSRSSGGMSTVGWFIEPRLNIQSRFFVIPGIRLDNNGLQGSRSGMLGLPKMSFSWIASDEDYFPWKNIIDLFRLRVALGSAGTQPGPRDRLRLYQVDTGEVALDSQYRFGSTLATLGNTRLRPERSTEYEWGFDTELWNNRVNLEFTTYRKTLHDAIVDVPVAPSISTGNVRDTYRANIGVIRNSGTEISARIVVLESSRYGWLSQVTFTKNANLVTKLNAAETPILISEAMNFGTGAYPRRRVVAGYPLWGLWARPLIGFNDADGNGIIGPYEIILADSAVYLGQPEPQGQMNFANDWTFLNGRLTLHTTMSYVHGLTQTATVMHGAMSPLNQMTNSPNATLLQKAIAVSASKSAYAVTQTVNTWRFESASINWDVGYKAAKVFRSRRMSIALQGRNLGMKSNYFGKDPNVSAVQRTSGMTVDSGLIPQPRMWTLRIALGN